MPNASTIDEDEWLSDVSRGGQESFSASDLNAHLGMSLDSAHRVINRWLEAGRVMRLQRGRYLVVTAKRENVAASPSEGRVLQALITDLGGQYQLCGAITFQRYGWDDQIPQRLSVYNTLYSGEKQVGAARLNLIKVATKRIGATVTSRSMDGSELVWPTKARALLDAVYDWSRFNSLPNAYHWIRTEAERDDGFVAELTDAALRFGNQGTVRRFGRLLTDIGVPLRLLRQLEKHTTETSSFIAWDPSQPKRGSIDHRWGVIINVEP